MPDLKTLKSEDLRLIHFADAAMTTRPPAFEFIADETNAALLTALLTETMLRLGGIGLSANQVGLPFRAFVFGNTVSTKAMFNPNLVGASREKTVFKEGCLSFPGFFLTLSRPASIVISYQDVTGAVQTEQYDGIAARIIQHEYDHMEGLNFTNHASHYKLEHEFKRWKKQYHKQLEKMQRQARRQQLPSTELQLPNKYPITPDVSHVEE